MKSVLREEEEAGGGEEEEDEEEEEGDNATSLSAVSSAAGVGAVSVCVMYVVELLSHLQYSQKK